MSRRRRRRGGRAQTTTAPSGAGLESPFKRERFFNAYMAFAFGLGMFVALTLSPAYLAVPGLALALSVLSAALLSFSFSRIFVRPLFLQRRRQQRQAQSTSLPPQERR